VSRRLAALVLLSLGITFVVFVLTQLVPADPAIAALGQDATPDSIEAFHARYDLDAPLPTRYARYLGHVLRGDLGVSQQTQNPVTRDLGASIPATAELAFFSITIALVFGVGFGLVSALSRDRPLDYGLRVVSLAGVSIPTFWIALVGLYLLYFKYSLVPGSGRLDPTMLPPPHITGFYTVDSLAAGDWSAFGNAVHHLLLPALVLAAFNIGVLTRYTRSAVLEVIEQDYIRAARAKGLPERVIIVRHVLRAALPSIITVVGLMFANVLVGAVLVETIFAWPGLGQYAYRSATTLDLPAIAGVSLFVAFVYISVNFVVDILYGVLDPRIRLAE
jgi:peptide/nickel transport system permease protein